MVKSKKNKQGMISINKTVALNKRAKFDYHIEEIFEAGIMLTGTEVKSLRLGQCSLNESYVGPKHNEIWLFNAHIPEYKQAGKFQHEPHRPRKLLLHKKEVNKLLGSVNKEGYSIVPIKLYFNNKGLAKLEIGLGKGKKQHDKRETIKSRDWGRQKQRIIREKNR